MKFQLAPSILSCDFAQMAPSVEQMMQAGVAWIHFDVMDGQFVPPITFGDAMVRGLRKLGPTPFEAHLMTQTPESHFSAFRDAGCERIIFHAEATHHAHRLCGQLKEMGVGCGVAINPGTPVEALIPILPLLDVALVMTVNPGWGGQPFLPECLDKVRALRQLRPDLEIEVDGGIDLTTLPTAWEAGANVFVAGSYLMRGDSVAERIRELTEACA
ncbi:MAG TPA: ribulose-phosphate 3-epimerase [Fimbriimonadaceae bacterium]|nr:ribulose-phosphate 3-epimerase [Fimbriimonadaceae bacterium]HRJ32411.1 ribulose-phosphate 3-epimerase [Fimbriimonadaceae bacterium]